MAEEVSPESKLYVNEEIEKSRKEFKEDLEKAQSRATKTFATIALIVGLLGSLGVYGLVKNALNNTTITKLNDNAKEIVKNLEEKKNEINKIESVTSHLVPNGGIIPWHPGEQFIERSQDGIKIKAPYGWAICDGENGTPDLRGQFLRGLPSDVSVADFLKNPAKKAGQAEHDHGTHDHGEHSHRLLTFKDRPPDRNIPVNGSTMSSFTRSSTVPKASVPKASHLPPYVNVVYIMRLGNEKGSGNPNRP